MNWKFELTYESATIVVSEPAGWDDVEFSLKREFKSYGMSFEFSSELSFYGVARQFIIDAYEAGNIDARIDIKISERKSANDAYSIFYEGVLKLNDIEIDATFAKVKIEQSGFNREFRGQRDLDVSLIANKTVKLHSKAIRKRAKWNVDSEFSAYDNEPATREFYALPLFFLKQNEFDLDDLQLPYYFDDSDVGLLSPFFVSEVAQDVIFRAKIKCRVRADWFSTATAPFSVYFHVGQTLAPTFDELLLNITITNGVYADIDIDIDKIIPMGEGDKIWIIFFYNIFTATTVFRFYVDMDEASFIDLYQDTTGKPSEAKGIMLFDAFNQITENYTGLANRFESNFFEVGCGNNILLTNGFQLRGLDKPIVANFDKLFESLRAIFNLGVAVQKESGVEVVRVDSFETFFSDSEFGLIDEPNDLVRNVFTDLYFNKIQVGYEKWQDSALGQINGLDEFNSKRQYATLLKMGEFKDSEKNRKELNLLCKDLITSGYLIEYMRRKIGLDTTDTNFDNDLFLICLNQSTVVSDKYSADGLSDTYSIGTISERNEAFSLVQNIIDPATAYNLRLSPVRSLHRWKSYIASQSVKGNANLGEIQFRSTEGNGLMRSEIDDVCEIEGIITENGNVSILLGDVLPIFEAEQLTLSYPLKFTDFKALLNDNQDYFKININGKVLKGYVLELSYKPNQGLAKFKLLKKYL